MGVAFLHINDAHREDLDSLALIANVTKEKGLRNKDEFWVNLILDYIISIYNGISQKEKLILKTKNE